MRRFFGIAAAHQEDQTLLGKVKRADELAIEEGEESALKLRHS